MRFSTDDITSTNMFERFCVSTRGGEGEVVGFSQMVKTRWLRHHTSELGCEKPLLRAGVGPPVFPPISRPAIPMFKTIFGVSAVQSNTRS